MSPIMSVSPPNNAPAYGLVYTPISPPAVSTSETSNIFNGKALYYPHDAARSMPGISELLACVNDDVLAFASSTGKGLIDASDAGHKEKFNVSMHPQAASSCLTIFCNVKDGRQEPTVTTYGYFAYAAIF